MRAVVCSKYGTPDVLHLRDVEKPVPRADEVLIAIKATTCHIGDVRVRSADVPWWLQLPFRLYMGFRKPKRPILGMELAGVVAAAGSAVRRFAVGNAVLASCPFKLGAHAEYICLPANAPNVKRGLVALKPSNMSFEEAAAGLATGGLTALGVLRKAEIEPGRSVLIYGASGSVGVFAVQLAKYFGATVTGVCSSKNADLVRSLGADAVLDYTEPGFASGAQTFDVVFDAVGKLSGAAARRLSGANGLRLSVATDIGSPARVTTAELTFLTGLVEAGKLRTHIDRRYSLEEIKEAHAYVGQWRKRGHVVITVDAG
jgi:NADPH:quinone reductase-like Zn-dependent oxidoreductase